MIHIEISTDQDAIKQIEMTGHAGYADPGYDIVCAAVSSQIISVENSLSYLLNIEVESVVDEVEGGYLKITLPAIASKQTQHDAQVLLKHLVLAFEVLEDSYPEFINMHIN